MFSLCAGNYLTIPNKNQVFCEKVHCRHIYTHTHTRDRVGWQGYQGYYVIDRIRIHDLKHPTMGGWGRGGTTGKVAERTIAPLEIEMRTERITESALGNCGPSVQIYLTAYLGESTSSSSKRHTTYIWCMVSLPIERLSEREHYLSKTETSTSTSRNHLASACTCSWEAAASTAFCRQTCRTASTFSLYKKKKN